MNWPSRLSFILLSLLLTAAAPTEFRSHRGMNYLEVLELNRSFSESDLKSAFRKAIMKVHPDHGGSVRDAQFVTEAYQVLKDDRLRKAYFRWLGVDSTETSLSPQKSAGELRRENIRRMAEEVFNMAAENLARNPSFSVGDMALRASTLILSQSRFFMGQLVGTEELAELMDDYVLGESIEASHGQRFILALGVIDLLRRSAPPGYEEGAESRAYLNRLTGQLELDIRNRGVSSPRAFLDRIYERLTGRSILREPPRPPPSPTISACEAVLRYQEAAGLGGEIPSRVDIRF